MPKARKAKTEPKYKHLSANFMRGSFTGQLLSVYRDKHNTDKLHDFKKAINDGEVVVDSEITKMQAEKMKELGLSVPQNTKIKQRAERNAA